MARKTRFRAVGSGLGVAPWPLEVPWSVRRYHLWAGRVRSVRRTQRDGSSVPETWLERPQCGEESWVPVGGVRRQQLESEEQSAREA